MAIVSYCGNLSQSGARWSPYMEIHFESVDPTEMRSDFGLRGFTLTSIHQRIAWQNVQFGSFTSNERCSVAFSKTDDVLTSCAF